MDTSSPLRRISSRWTVAPKYFVPAALTSLVGFIVWAGRRDSPWWEIAISAALILLADIWAIAFAWDLCGAYTDGQVLHLRGLRKSAIVPLSEIKEVVGFTRSRWPHIDLVLRQPTSLGQELRIVPRADSLVSGGKTYWDVFDLLASHADHARHDAPDGKPRTLTGHRAPLVFAVTTLLVAAIVLGVLLVV